jgi:hypothetical protein
VCTSFSYRDKKVVGVFVPFRARFIGGGQGGEIERVECSLSLPSRSMQTSSLVNFPQGVRRASNKNEPGHGSAQGSAAGVRLYRDGPNRLQERKRKEPPFPLKLSWYAYIY